MSNTNTTMFNRVIKALKKAVNGLTVAQLKEVGGDGAQARVHEARVSGYAIYSNKKTFANGRTTTVYRLGKPSERFTRNMRAGRTQIAVRSLYSRAA